MFADFVWVFDDYTNATLANSGGFNHFLGLILNLLDPVLQTTLRSLGAPQWGPADKLWLGVGLKTDVFSGLGVPEPG